MRARSPPIAARQDRCRRNPHRAADRSRPCARSVPPRARPSAARRTGRYGRRQTGRAAAHRPRSGRERRPGRWLDESRRHRRRSPPAESTPEGAVHPERLRRSRQRSRQRGCSPASIFRPRSRPSGQQSRRVPRGARHCREQRSDQSVSTRRGSPARCRDGIALPTNSIARKVALAGTTRVILATCATEWLSNSGCAMKRPHRRSTDIENVSRNVRL